MRRSGSTIRRTAVGAAPAALTFAIVMLAPLALPAPATAQPRCAQPAAVVRTIDNRVQVVLASTGAPVAATREMQVCAGDRIEVLERSRAIVFITASNSLLVLDQNSELRVGDADSKAPGTFVNLVRGALLFITRLRSSFEVRTPFVNASVEGTEFVVRVGVDRTVVTVLEGTVRAANDLGAVDVGAGQQAVAVKGQAPQLQVVVRPRDAVQWALYYEPVLPADTFERLGEITAANQDAAFFVRRASLLLGVGQLEAARADLDQAEKLDTANGEVPALRTIVAVALNDKSQALESGRLAVQRRPNSTSARLALSYALQANFQLGEARDEVEAAVATAPDDAAALTRLAELRLMLDDVGGAAEAAERAVKLAPEAARPLTVLGFTSLARLKVSDAERQFEQAIGLASSDPLAHLGHGLARIRRGNLAEGRSDLELAVALSPDDAIIRSYLGKAYFDEKRDPLAGQQFASAKVLDPLDPTAWYYDAIRQQTINRPVEALRDLQRSIQLNGNRAVYRSRFLLDQDLAVRGTRLGRIYRDLGFEQLGLLEASTSLNVDPSNYSAHRLLADSYLTLPRHQIARDSELLQAQLLQPLNFNPVQPRLADDGLVFLDEVGTSGIGFNEYTRLFAASQIRFVADGITGGQSTNADNLILSGVFQRMSFSAGQSYFATDGVRVNNYTKQRVNHVFVQTGVGSKTGIQFEARVGDADTGDRRILFDSSVVRPRRRNLSDNASLRFGLRRDLARDSKLLLSYMRRSLEVDFTDGTGLLDFSSDETAHLVEGQYLHDFRRLDITTGIGHYAGDRVEHTTIRSVPSPTVNIDVSHTNAYLYSGLNFHRNLVVIAGLSADVLDGSLVDRDQINPKLGFTWNVTRRTTVRTGIFKAFQRTLISSQTIEPTQIAGFNQFFFDAEGTQSWRYAIGVDSSFTDRLYLGADFSVRDMAVPFRLPTGTRDVDQEEHFGRAYVYVPLTNNIALTTDYQRERLIHDPQSRFDFLVRSTTHRMSPEVRLFHPSGVFARFKVTFVDQAGEFWSQRFVLTPGTDRFSTIDAAIGYRLPRRLGTIAVDGRNLLDSTFMFQDSNPEESRVMSRRLVTMRLTLSL